MASCPRVALVHLLLQVDRGTRRADGGHGPPWGWNLASVAEGKGHSPDGAGEMGCQRPGPSTWSSRHGLGPSKGMADPGGVRLGGTQRTAWSMRAEGLGRSRS